MHAGDRAGLGSQLFLGDDLTAGEFGVAVLRWAAAGSERHGEAMSVALSQRHPMTVQRKDLAGRRSAIG